MSTSKEKARLPEELVPAVEPLVIVCGVEDIRCKSPTTFNLTERINMTTMEAKEAPPGMERKPALSGEPSRLSSFPMLETMLEVVQPALANGASSSSKDAHGASSSSRDESWQIQDDQKQVIQTYVLPGDTGNAPASPGLVQIGSQSADGEHGSMHQPEVVTDARGKAPIGITLETAELTPPSPNECFNLNITPTQSVHEAHKTNDPSKAPKGSLIHTLYRQLLDAGDEGMTLPELLASFKMRTAWQNFESDWEKEVQFHVENNPHVREVRKYSLQPSLQQQPKPSSPIMCMSPTIAADTTGELELSLGSTQQRNIEHLAPPPRATKQVTAGDLELSLLTTLGCNMEVPPLPPTAPLPPSATRQWFSMNHPKDLHIRKKACQAGTEAFVTPLTSKLEKIPIEETELHKQMTEWIAAWVADPSSSQPPTRMQVPKWNAKRKSLSDGTEQAEQQNWLNVPIHDRMPKQQAEALAKPYEMDATKRARQEADDELQVIPIFDSKGCQDLPAYEMHATEMPLVLTDQPVEPKLISSVGAVSCVDHNHDECAEGHPNGQSVSKVNPKEVSGFPEKLEL